VFIVHIPYRGAAPAVADVLGGQVQIAIVGMPPVVGPAKQGKLRIVAVTSEKRSAAMPEVPAVAELPGFAGYRFTNWQGVFMAAKTPSAIIERLAGEIGNAVREPATREKLLSAGVEPAGLSTAEFTAFLAREQESYARIAKSRNIKADE
jgi:tripartite-type tricarboxylate transporter receptor subunit TctC